MSSLKVTLAAAAMCAISLTTKTLYPIYCNGKRQREIEEEEKAIIEEGRLREKRETKAMKAAGSKLLAGCTINYVPSNVTQENTWSIAPPLTYLGKGRFWKPDYTSNQVPQKSALKLASVDCYRSFSRIKNIGRFLEFPLRRGPKETFFIIVNFQIPRIRNPGDAPFDSGGEGFNAIFCFEVPSEALGYIYGDYDVRNAEPPSTDVQMILDLIQDNNDARSRLKGIGQLSNEEIPELSQKESDRLKVWSDFPIDLTPYTEYYNRSRWLGIDVNLHTSSKLSSSSSRSSVLQLAQEKGKYLALNVAIFLQDDTAPEKLVPNKLLGSATVSYIDTASTPWVSDMIPAYQQFVKEGNPIPNFTTMQRHSDKQLLHPEVLKTDKRFKNDAAAIEFAQQLLLEEMELSSTLSA